MLAAESALCLRQGWSVPVRIQPYPCRIFPFRAVPEKGRIQFWILLDPPDTFQAIVFDFGVKYVFDFSATCFWTFHKNPILSSNHSHTYLTYMGRWILKSLYGRNQSWIFCRKLLACYQPDSLKTLSGGVVVDFTFSLQLFLLGDVKYL